MGLILALGAGQAFAVGDISINGFLTAAGTVGDNDDNAYLNGLVDGDASFDTLDSRLGLQITAPINERMDLTAQLLARGGNNQWQTEADWAFVSYQVSDPLQARAGKVKLSTFLVSDYIEVGYAYPWIRPPVEVYTLNPITTISGVDLLYRPSAGDWTFLIQPYVGNSNGEAIPSTPVATLASMTPGVPVEFEAQDMVGLNVSAGTDAFNFRIGYLETEVTSDALATPPGMGASTATFASAGFSMDWRNIVAFAEYAERDEENMAEMMFPDQSAWYATLGYRMGKFLPHLTYAKLDEGQDIPAVPADIVLRQESTTLGLRYELASGAALKFEASQVEPETGNVGLFAAPLAAGEEEHMLYSVAIDVIF